MAWIKATDEDTMPVQVVTMQGADEFETLSEAREKYPDLDPFHSRASFTWAMRGRLLDGREAMRFENWAANNFYSL